jgi:hypothetical protein
LVAAVAPATVGPIVIDVPDGFQPVQTQKLKRKLTTAWTKSVRGSLKTLLQIEVVDLGPGTGHAFPTDQDLTLTSDRFLRQSLAAVAARRSGFAASPLAHIKLADLPASRASWNGALAGRGTVGVLYCVIVRNRFVVSLHTQDLGDAPTSGMFEAMKSIESISVPGQIP